MPEATIRPAAESDVPAIQEMIRELAEFEKLSDQVTSTDADLQAALFGESSCAEALVAAEGDRPIGYALFFTNYSTFNGRPGLYLEDVYVRPAHRGTGVGKQLLKQLAAIAAERDYGRMDWSVLDWNQRAIDFYESHGASVLQEWRFVRTEREGIQRLAGQAAPSGDQP